MSTDSMKQAQHPTQIFMSNPQALRVEYRVDDSRLLLWWSPRAGESSHCDDRNYSSRDAHLNVFESILCEDCGLESFQRCDYDPYHSVLYFDRQTLHIAVAIDSPLVFLWAEQAQEIHFESFRFDEPLSETDTLFSVIHREPRYTFEFTAGLGAGTGSFKHCSFHAEGQPRFSRVNLSPSQMLVIGCQLEGKGLTETVKAFAKKSPVEQCQTIDTRLADVESCGHTVSEQFPDLETMRRNIIRGLHSMIDESGAYRASLKAIYYLIWIRDAGFSFAYQSAAGWPHKLRELCRLLLDNPVTIQMQNGSAKRMFGQLVNRKLGKLEEDGTYYVVWTLFTQWTQNGDLSFVGEDDWQLIDESLSVVEQLTWDDERGLYGEHFADETPTTGCRDFGWDYAMGKPLSKNDCLMHNGQAVSRNYDVYFNIIMHSTYVMLAAMRDNTQYTDMANRVWKELEKLLHIRQDGIPVYGELLMDSGERVLSDYWGEASSCCVWGLTMQNFIPLDDWDEVLAATMDSIIAKPEMHWINGICSAMAAVDSWFYDEQRVIDLHKRIAEETNTPGPYLPMGGAMPEKFNAPQGNLYHDIRPQGFAMGAWLAAWSSLGLRRLAHGLAVRPTQAFTRLENYQWRGKVLTFDYGPKSQNLALKINGNLVTGTLQIPEESLSAGANTISIVEAQACPLLLRSSVELISANAGEYQIKARGISSITFTSLENEPALYGAEKVAITTRWSHRDTSSTVHFNHTGVITFSL